MDEETKTVHRRDTQTVASSHDRTDSATVMGRPSRFTWVDTHGATVRLLTTVCAAQELRARIDETNAHLISGARI